MRAGAQNTLLQARTRARAHHTYTQKQLRDTGGTMLQVLEAARHLQHRWNHVQRAAAPLSTNVCLDYCNKSTQLQQKHTANACAASGDKLLQLRLCTTARLVSAHTPHPLTCNDSGSLPRSGRCHGC